ncbi:hypothetical protein UPYG_G00232300 [Umbra pygmaea]|uniref:t-SNARE coiled-coil homology domain-containing protein n=1 Tax=Umbra pygmaea TaxID=75934 RepID=A0ABD0WII6_UMBPY
MKIKPQYVRLENSVSSTVLSSMGAPQGTVLAPFLFTIYTADFQYNTDRCFLQKYSDDTTVVGLIRGDDEEEYRGTLNNFVQWSADHHLHLNTTKTKEMVVDFRRGRRRIQPTPVTTRGTEVELVVNHKYLGAQLDSKLDWKCHMESVYCKGQSQLYFLRRLRSFNICQPFLGSVYQTVVASALFFAVACWGDSVRTADRNRVDKLIKKAGSVVGAELGTVQQVAGARTLIKLGSILANPAHPLNLLKVMNSSTFSQRLLAPRCKSERYRRASNIRSTISSRMRDRLKDLQGVTPTHSDEDDGGQGDKDEDTEMQQQSVLFEDEDLMDGIFREAQSVRKDIVLLQMDVKRLGKQNTRFLTSVRRFSSIKRDTNDIARGIKTQGEGIYKRLERIGTKHKELEDEHGAHSALVRMVHAQYISLTAAFHEAMSEYNQAEMSQRENCKTRIQRQAEIMGKEVTGEQIEEMVETGKWNVFSDNLLTDGRTARSALTEIENRHKELLELESRIRDIHELFFQMALLVEEQGAMVDNIEANVLATADFVSKAQAEIKRAVKYKKNNPCRKLFCCCFPCCNK